MTLTNQNIWLDVNATAIWISLKPAETVRATGRNGNDDKQLFYTLLWKQRNRV